MKAPPLPAIDQLEHLVWLQTAFLGDIVLTTAALHLAKKAFPHCQQWMITTPLGEKALAACPELDGILLFDKRRRSLFQEAQACKRALALQGARLENTVLLQAHRSLRSSLMGMLLGLARLTFAESQLSCLASRTVNRIAAFHESQRNALLLEALSIQREDILACRPTLPPASQASAACERIFAASPHSSAKRFIGLAPGSVWGTKRWPIEAFCQLADRLLNLEESELILIGSREESPLAESIVNYIATHSRPAAKASLWNLAGQTSLDDLRYLFPRLHLLVSNDSSPIHYASAFNTPTLALFGATTPAMGFGPLAARSLSLGVDDLACRPCSDHGPPTCPLGHFHCMKKLGVDTVFQACLDLLRH